MIVRKLTKLKAMGVNAIRSSHNPPAPELLSMCDTMGLIVMDESFDMWRRRKTQNEEISALKARVAALEAENAALKARLKAQG